jgi:hypothetical protein
MTLREAHFLLEKLAAPELGEVRAELLAAYDRA